MDLRPAPTYAEDPAALLEWYVEMGVGEALDETPRNRFEEAPPARAAAPPVTKPPAAAAASRPAPAREALATPPDEATLSARQLAEAATTLDELRAAMAGFEGCALKATAKSLVFADGNPRAKLMLVGEAPGGDEDRVGLPFVGRSGQLLDRMLAAIGLDRAKDVYIANLLPWRPPGNRTPTTQEVQICLPFIKRQIALCDPDLLVCVGGPSMQALLGQGSILKMRGKWLEYDTGQRTLRAMAMLHPAYLLRQPLQKRLAWRDLQTIREALKATAGWNATPSCRDDSAG